MSTSGVASTTLGDLSQPFTYFTLSAQNYKGQKVFNDDQLQKMKCWYYFALY